MAAIFTSYDPATGEISKTELASSLAEAHANALAGHETVEGAYYPAHTWFPNGEPVEKADIVVTVDGRTISGLPDPCAILVNGVTASTATGGSFTFAADHVGAIIKAPAYKDAHVFI